MTRMLGRVHVRGLSPNCAMREGRYCRDCGWDGRMGSRAAKRLEARELTAEVFEHTGREIPVPFTDLSDCRHGCNGDSPCGEQCNFTCHPGDT